MGSSLFNFSFGYTREPGLYGQPLEHLLLFSRRLRPRHDSVVGTACSCRTLFKFGSVIWPLELDRVSLYPFYAVPETLEVLLAWALVRERLKGKTWDPSPRNIIMFGVQGILIPAVFMSLAYQTLLYLAGETTPSEAFRGGVNGWMGDMLGGTAIALPLLISVSPWLDRKGWSLFKTSSFELKWAWKMPVFRERMFIGLGFVGSPLPDNLGSLVAELVFIWRVLNDRGDLVWT